MKVKKILLTLGISIISLIGVTHGVSQQWFSNGLYNTTYSNLRDNTLNLYIPTDYAFYTTVGDTQYNSIYAIYDKIFFYWDTEGILSIYNGVTARNSATKGGLKLNKFYICDYISGDFNSFTNCTQYDYDPDTVNTYLNSTVSTDRIIYGDGKVSNYEVNLVSNSIPFIAFSIEGVQKTILFYSPIGYIYNSPGSFEYGLPNVNGQVNYNVSFTGNYDITTFPDYYLGNSPIGKTNGNTGNTSNKFCPPIRFQIDMYGSRFNTGLCYSNTQTISGNQVIEETPITMLEAFPTYQDYNNARNLFTDYCHTDYQNTTEECQTALQSIGRKKAQIVWKAIKNNQDNTILKRERIYQYCYLNLTYTGDDLRDIGRCELTDEQKYAPGLDNSGNPNPLDGYEDMLLNSETEIELPPDGTVFDEILPDGIISWNNLFTNFDFIGNLVQLTTKIFILFKLRPIVEGILPPVIMSLLLLIILFRIFKK